MVALRRDASALIREKTLLAAYTAGVIAAEVVLVYVSFLAGLFLHAVLVFSALTGYALASRRAWTGASAAYSPASLALAALSLVPLIRVMSAGTAVKEIPLVFLTGVALVPVMMAAVLAARAIRDKERNLRLKVRSLLFQLLIGLSGIAVGVAGFLAVRPNPMERVGGQGALLASMAIMALGGVTEEVVFRGVVQTALEKVSGVASIAWSNVLFATLYVGSRPLLLLPFMAAAGLYFGWCARGSKSITGVCIAHALTNVVFVVAPVVI